jgi:hypothetical protein
MQDKTRGAVIDETRRIRTEDVQGHEDPDTTPPPSPQGDGDGGTESASDTDTDGSDK